MPSSDWLGEFPHLSGLDAEAQRLLLAQSQIVTLPIGTRIFGPGQTPASYIMARSGTVRVQQVSESGREIVLYRVSAGETCALTTACLMGYETYQAEGLAETEVVAVAIPRETFEQLISRSSAFRRFVFSAFSQRITNLFRLVEDVAFSRIDIRLAQKLLELAGSSDKIALTHQQLASELGTAREVISRQLHEFQRRGWVSVARGALSLTDRDELRRLGNQR